MQGARSASGVLPCLLSRGLCWIDEGRQRQYHKQINLEKAKTELLSYSTGAS